MPKGERETERSREREREEVNLPSSPIISRPIICLGSWGPGCLSPISAQLSSVACEAVSARRGEPAPRSEGGALEAALALKVRRSISRSTRRCSLSAFSTEREIWLMRLSSPAA